MTDCRPAKCACPEASITWWRDVNLPSFALLSHFPRELQEDFVFWHLDLKSLGRLSSTNKLLRNKMLEKMYKHYMQMASTLLIPKVAITVYYRTDHNTFERHAEQDVCWTWIGDTNPENQPDGLHNLDEFNFHHSREHFCTKRYADRAKSIEAMPTGADVLVAASCVPYVCNSQTRQDTVRLRRAREHIISHGTGSAEELDAGSAIMRCCTRQSVGYFEICYSEYDWHVYSGKATRACRTVLPNGHRTPAGKWAHLRVQQNDQNVQKHVSSFTRDLTTYKIRCRTEIDKAFLLAQLKRIFSLPESTRPEDVSFQLLPDPEVEFNTDGLWHSTKIPVEWKILKGLEWPQVVVEANSTVWRDIKITANTTIGKLEIITSLTCGPSTDTDIAAVVLFATGDYVGPAKESPAQIEKLSRRLRKPTSQTSTVSFSDIRWTPIPKPSVMAFRGNQSLWRLDSSV